MKYRDVQERLRMVGIVMSKSQGRIRINHFGATAETAYFTDCLEDALKTGQAMAEPSALAEAWCAERT